MRSYKISEEEYITLSDFFTAFSDSTRLKILTVLLDGKKTVTELSKLVNISQSAISHQLTKLRMLKLVKSEKLGKFNFYKLDDEHIEIIIKLSLEHIREV